MIPASTLALLRSRHTDACITGQLDFEPCRCRPPAKEKPEVRR